MDLDISELEEGEIECDRIPPYTSTEPPRYYSPLYAPSSPSYDTTEPPGNYSPSYSPLERPANYSSTINPSVPPVVDSESDGELQTTSDSDSDSDSQFYRAKKPKIKPKRPTKPSQNPATKKYNVWSNRIQEDVLLETLNSCDVTQKDRSRNIESYDYTLSFSHRSEERRKGREGCSDKIEGNCKRKHNGRKNNERDVKYERTNNKRTRDDRRNKSIRLTGNKEKTVKLNARVVPDLNVSEDSTDKEFSVELANKLCEEKETLMEKIVNTLGREKSLKIFKEVQRIEANGGMFLTYLNRRRTPGGIFFFLVKHDNEITKDQHDIIFEEDKLKYKEILKERKKQRAKERKAKIVGEKSTTLPELLTKAAVFERQTDKWSPAGSDHDDVVNPPPTPETDGHADSGDGMEPSVVNDSRKVDSYEDDFLEINAGNEMDLF